MSEAGLRNQHIDILRGIAILLVLVLHFHLAYHIDHSAFTKIFSRGFITALAQNGNYGVTMFFVISGFLITSNSLMRYEKLANLDLLGFYILRFARIMPCLLLVLLMILLFNFTPLTIFKNNPHSTSLALAFFSILTFWHNVLMVKFGWFNYCLNIYWSLSVEEVFYFAFPLLCLFLKRTRLMIIFWMVLIIVAPIYRSFYVDNEIVAMCGYFSCFDAIAIGCCTAVIINSTKFKQFLCCFKDWNLRKKILVTNIIKYAATLMLMAVYFYTNIANDMIVGFSLMAIGTAILLAIGANQEDLRCLKNTNKLTKIICWFGRNSYELYLFHIIMLAVMRSLYGEDALGDYGKILWMTIFFLASVLLAGTIAKLYSQPMNKKLRQMLFGWLENMEKMLDIYPL
jgi:peptidoglycan/LPS O-acetylase OafA/YrhL